MKMHVIVQGYGENQIYFFQPFCRHVCVKREVLTSKEAIGKKDINCMTSGKMSNLNDAKSNDSLTS